MRLSRSDLAGMIDSTLVKPTATKGEILRLCREAVQHKFHAVCVNSAYVPLAAQALKGTSVKVCSTVGFPYGSALPEAKAYEAERAVERGADEVDMVINVGWLKSGDVDGVRRDIQGVVKAVKRLNPSALVKVIIETGYLTGEEKVLACRAAVEAGADFVKTCTGLVGRATVEDVQLMRKTVGERVGVKAAGGIRTYEDALAMIRAGANRIGTSTAVAVVMGAPE